MKSLRSFTGDNIKNQVTVVNPKMIKFENECDCFIEGSAPKPLGFIALQTKAWGQKNGRVKTTATCFGHLIRRSGCFPALPYPPEQMMKI
jgi:hypothetical protein